MISSVHHSIHCKNCGNHFEGKYCNVCGQKAIVTRIDWRFVLHQAQHGVFHLEQGLFFTIRELFVRPGHAIGDYVAGKRVKYMSPLAYIVLTSLASYLLVRLLNTDGPITLEHDAGGTVGNFIIHYTDKLSLVILIPLAALFTKLFFPSSHYNFFELFAFHCFIRGQFAIIAMIMVLFDWFLVQMGFFLHPITIFVLQVVPNILLLGWAFHQFIAGKKLIYCILISLTIMAILSAIAVALAWLAVLIVSGAKPG